MVFDKKQWQKEYREKNKEKLKLKSKEYSENNKQKIKEKGKEYREKNKKKIKIRHKECREKYKEINKEKIKKCFNICQWKNSGLIAINYELIYDRYYFSSHCEEPKCNKEYTKENKKCMDHCHDTGLFRNILCNSCNTKRRTKKNSSGTTNISWCNTKNSWRYKIQINGKIHCKYSKNLEWLKNYKKEYENKYLYV